MSTSLVFTVLSNIGSQSSSECFVDIPVDYTLRTKELYDKRPPDAWFKSIEEDPFAKEVLPLLGDKWSMEWESFPHLRNWMYPSFRRWRRCADLDKRHGFGVVWNRDIQRMLGVLGDVKPCFHGKDEDGSICVVFRIGARIYYLTKVYGNLLIRPMVATWSGLPYSPARPDAAAAVANEILRMVEDPELKQYDERIGSGDFESFTKDVQAELVHMLVDFGKSPQDMEGWDAEHWMKALNEYDDTVSDEDFFDYHREWYDRLGVDPEEFSYI